MSLSKGYGVLKCRAIAGKKEFNDNSPHYQVHVSDGRFDYRLAINVKSIQKPYDLLYFIDNNFKHYITDKLEQLDFGFTRIQDKNGGIALDYIRGNLFNIKKMRPLPYDLPGGNNDLNELIDVYIQRAIASKASIYAFGEPWGIEPPENQPDKIFGFQPNRGVHNIHMNQGSRGKFAQDNGVYQDGGLLIHYPSTAPFSDIWVAAFFAFQSQSFHTDDRTGNPIDKRVGFEPPQVGVPVMKAPVRIIAALINPFGDDTAQKESVTLINSSPENIDLTNWKIVNQLQQKYRLERLKLEPGGVVKVTFNKDFQLSNQGGTISLLNSENIKVDGVSYTKEDIKQQGWTIVF